jgi:hypothetical protein
LRRGFSGKRDGMGMVAFGDKKDIGASETKLL